MWEAIRIVPDVALTQGALLHTSDLSYQSANPFCPHLSDDMMATVNIERSFLQSTQYEWCYFEHQ
jgi:hypothetical protein